MSYVEGLFVGRTPVRVSPKKERGLHALDFPFGHLPGLAHDGQEGVFVRLLVNPNQRRDIGPPARY
jgi:hypothetical protein